MAWSRRSYAPRIYAPGSAEPFKVSRSKIDLFLECPRCYFLEARLGVKRPSGPPFTLNVAVDGLLKKEFDLHRVKGTPHPLMNAYKVDAVPFDHPGMDEWRQNFVGIRVLHTPTNLLVFGAVDDIWRSADGALHVVDYKATAKDEAVTELGDTRFHDQYRRQMEVYQWLLRGNGFEVSDVGYFVYVNGRKDKAAFDGKLEFDVNLIPYKGDGAWIEGALSRLKQCLDAPLAPASSDGCEYCVYRAAAGTALMKNLRPNQDAPEKPRASAKPAKKGAPVKGSPEDVLPTLF